MANSFVILNDSSLNSYPKLVGTPFMKTCFGAKIQSILLLFQTRITKYRGNNDQKRWKALVCCSFIRPENLRAGMELLFLLPTWMFVDGLVNFIRNFREVSISISMSQKVATIFCVSKDSVGRARPTSCVSLTSRRIEWFSLCSHFMGLLSFQSKLFLI